MGFKDISVLSNELNLRSPYFLYPNEVGVPELCCLCCVPCVSQCLLAFISFSPGVCWRCRLPWVTTTTGRRVRQHCRVPCTPRKDDRARQGCHRSADHAGGVGPTVCCSRGAGKSSLFSCGNTRGHSTCLAFVCFQIWRRAYPHAPYFLCFHHPAEASCGRVWCRGHSSRHVLDPVALLRRHSPHRVGAHRERCVGCARASGLCLCPCVVPLWFAPHFYLLTVGTSCVRSACSGVVGLH